MPAAKGRKLVQALAALAVLAALALPADASIPRPGQLPGPNPEALLAAVRDAPDSQPAATPRAVGFELFSDPIGDRFRLDLHAAAQAPAQARFNLLTPPKNRIRGVNLPEPLLIGVELPPSRTTYRLYGELPYGFASGGLYITTDPLGYVDGPNLYQYGLNNPVSFSDPMGLVSEGCSSLPEEAAEACRRQREAAAEQFVKDAKRQALFYKTVAWETLTLPDRLGEGMTQLGPNLWALSKEFSDLGQDAFICVSDPVECLSQAREFFGEVPAELSQAWNDWVNMPEEEHIKRWARATVDVGSGFATSEVVVPRFLARAGGPGGGVGRTFGSVSGSGSEELVTVSRWGREGLEAGDFVMRGTASRTNYVFSGKWQPGFGNQFAPFRSGQQFRVPPSTLVAPGEAASATVFDRGVVGWIKKLLGQRAYKP